MNAYKTLNQSHRSLFFFFFFNILETKNIPLWCPLISQPRCRAPLCPTPRSFQAFIYFPSPGIVFISPNCQGFPLHVFDFSIPSPQGSLLSQLTDICQWRSITTIADVEMLIPSPLGPRLPPLQVRCTSLLLLSAAGSCFCPLSSLAAGLRL